MTYDHPDNQDKLIVPPASESGWQELYDEATDLAPPDRPPIIPHLFTGPINGLPVAVVADVYQDEQGTGWVSLRTETVNGSQVVFLHPDVADHLAVELVDIAQAARAKLVNPNHQ